MSQNRSSSDSAWLARQRASAPPAYRAWVEEALRQAGLVGQLRAELQALAATVEAVLAVYEKDLYRDRRATDAILREAASRAQHAARAGEAVP